MDETTRQRVMDRAGGVCEYCHLPQSAYPVPFETDHIIAKQHGGTTILSNLALACLHDNGHKGGPTSPALILSRASSPGCLTPGVTSGTTIFDTMVRSLSAKPPSGEPRWWSSR